MGPEWLYGKFTRIAPRRRWKEAAMPGTAKSPFMNLMDI